MKSSKTILTRHLVLGVLLQVLVVLLIALPALEPYRIQAAELSGIPRSALWIPLLGILVVAHLFMLRRLLTHVVHPVQELVHQTRLGSASFAFKKKSMNSEEDHLKHFIESHSLKYAEMEQEVTRMENEVERISELAKTPPEEIDALRQNLDKATRKAEDQVGKLAAEQKRANDLERDMESLRRDLKRRGRELESLREELSEQSSDGEDAPLHSILAERLRNPLNLINNLSWRLAKSWADTPPSQIREGLEEISRQSEEQLELLKKYQVEKRPTGAERDAL